MYSIVVTIASQKLTVLHDGVIVREYQVSSAKKGVGEQFGSEQTPRGSHIIRAKIGDDCPINTVFVARRPTGEIYSHALRQANPDRDWILTRIFWLSGLQKGKNRLGKVDTMRRYIYIHGTPDETDMACPGSRGCLRMLNLDIIELYHLIPVGTLIDII